MEWLSRKASDCASALRLQACGQFPDEEGEYPVEAEREVDPNCLTKRDRTHFLRFVGTTFLVASTATALAVLRGGLTVQIGLALALGPFGSGGVMILLCLTQARLSHRVVSAHMVFMTVSMMILDLNQRIRSSDPTWSLFIVIADVSLLLRLGRHVVTGLVAFVTVCLVLFHLEGFLRFGLFDTPGSYNLEDRREYARRWFECDTPPCTRSNSEAIISMMFSLVVLLIDVWATRGFAEAAEREQAAMARTIKTVAEMASLLVRYDVDTVGQMLDAAVELPVAMREALRQLEQNLRAYRPYLPAVLLEQEQAQAQTVRRAAEGMVPGALSGEAAIVFTDIRASTAIWEAVPEAMKHSMRVHNQAVRDVLEAAGGYEVKTIGDAFMVAFEDAVAAMDFALAVHEKLLTAEWPPSLLKVAMCKLTGLWGGLTVRVGVNQGPVSLEKTPLTGRVDYFGHTVNVAARLEHACIPGAVAVPLGLWERVRTQCSPSVSGAATSKDLPGLKEAVMMYDVWPARLSERCNHPLDAVVSSQPRKCHTPSETWGSSGSLSMPRCLGDNHTRTDATIATVSLPVPDEEPLTNFSTRLESLLPLVEQSTGVLLSLLGEHLFVGWNLSRRSGVHAECALRFAESSIRASKMIPQLPDHTELAATPTLGIATGSVQYGNVGTSSQRFVTAGGVAVRASLAVWQVARETQQQCIYTAEMTTGAVRDLIRGSTFVEEVCWANRVRSFSGSGCDEHAVRSCGITAVQKDV